MEAPRDQNFVPTALAVSSADGITTLPFQEDPITGRLLADIASGSGTVTEIDTGTGLTGGPINTTGTIALDSKLAPLDTLGTAFQVPRVNAGATALEYYTPTAGTVTSVSGTVNRITSTGGATPVIDIAGTYVGQTSITTLGTITTGTLSTGAVIAGVTMTLGSDATGDIYYRNSGGVLTRLGIGSSTNVLTVSGGLPSWAAPAAASLVVGSTAISSGTTTRILYDNAGVLGEYTLTGTGTVAVMQNTPTLTTPVLGVATATSINGLVITTTTGTLTMTNGKTLAVTNSLTLSGTDSTTMTFPTTTATIARTDAAQTFTGIQTIPQVVNTPLAATVTSNAATITRASRINNFTNSSAATMAITLSTSGALDGDMLMVRIYDFSAVAQTIGWTNTENSTVTVPTTSNGSTTLPLTVGFQYNSGSSKWRCIAKA